MRAQTMNDIDLGLTNPDFERGHPALVNFSYKFKLPWLKVAEGMLRMQDFENKTRLTSIAGCDQIDDDRIVLYRRTEFSNSKDLLYEQIVVNRQNMSIENDRLIQNPNGTTSLMERQLLRPDLTMKKPLAVFDSYLHDFNGNQAESVENFKTQVGRITKSMLWAQWAKEDTQ